MKQVYWAEAESMRHELYRVARGRFALPHDDAQDVAQRTIIQTATHLQEPKALKEFAHRTMRRMVIDRWRSRSQNELPIVIDEEGWQAHESCMAGAIEILESVKDLNVDYAKALWLSHCGYTDRESARILGITYGALKSRLHRGRKMAREMAGFGTCAPHTAPLPSKVTISASEDESHVRNEGER